MSGLLLRLGARAIGQSGAVRPASCLPFAVAPSLVEPGLSPGQPQPAHRAPPIQPTPTGAAQVATPSVGTLDPGPEDPADPDRIRIARHGAEGQAPVALEPSAWVERSPFPLEPGLSRVGPGPAPLVQGPASVIGAAARATPEGNPDQPPPQVAMAHPAVGQTGHPGQPLAARDEPLGAETRLDEGLAPMVRRVEPLMPVSPHAAATPWQDARPDSSPTGVLANQGRVEESTEVHIHIGRIEVTAVHEPAPRRPSPRTAKPVTLDDYLAGRRGTRA